MRSKHSAIFLVHASFLCYNLDIFRSMNIKIFAPSSDPEVPNDTLCIFRMILQNSCDESLLLQGTNNSDQIERVCFHLEWDIEKFCRSCLKIPQVVGCLIWTLSYHCQVLIACSGG